MSIAIATGTALSGTPFPEGAAPGKSGKWDWQSAGSFPCSTQRSFFPNFQSFLGDKGDVPDQMQQLDRGPQESLHEERGKARIASGSDSLRMADNSTHKPTELKRPKRLAEQTSPALIAPNVAGALTSSPIAQKFLGGTERNASNGLTTKTEFASADSADVDGKAFHASAGMPSPLAASTLAGSSGHKRVVLATTATATNLPASTKPLQAEVPAGATPPETGEALGGQTVPALIRAEDPIGSAPLFPAPNKLPDQNVPDTRGDLKVRRSPSARETLPAASPGALGSSPIPIPQTQFTAPHTSDALETRRSTAAPASMTRSRHAQASSPELADLSPASNQPARETVVASVVSAPLRNLSDSPGAVHTQDPSRDAFTALDAANGPSKPAWVPTTSGRAEGGFHDPTLGWVGVRAQLNPDGLHAVVVPASAAAEQALDGHIAGLETHLTAQHIPVQSLSVAPPEGSGGVAENGNPGEGQHRQEQQRSSNEREISHASRTAAPDTPRPAMTSNLRPQNSQIGPRLRGAHISVIA
jgi:hypothetical protein